MNIPQISVPVNLFIDDTSTNVSKRWQPMHCAQMQLAGTQIKNQYLLEKVSSSPPESNDKVSFTDHKLPVYLEGFKV